MYIILYFHIQSTCVGWIEWFFIRCDRLHQWSKRIDIHCERERGQKILLPYRKLFFIILLPSIQIRNIFPSKSQSFQNVRIRICRENAIKSEKERHSSLNHRHFFCNRFPGRRILPDSNGLGNIYEMKEMERRNGRKGKEMERRNGRKGKEMERRNGRKGKEETGERGRKRKEEIEKKSEKRMKRKERVLRVERKRILLIMRKGIFLTLIVTTDGIWKGTAALLTIFQLAAGRSKDRHLVNQSIWTLSKNSFKN